MIIVEANCRCVSSSLDDWLQLGKIGCRETIYEGTELAQAKNGDECLSSGCISRGEETYSRGISVVELIRLSNWLLVEVERDNRVKNDSKFQDWKTGRMVIHLPRDVKYEWVWKGREWVSFWTC